jgi:1-deoxy-D-xylulose-5-phosphate synthase
MFDVGIAEQHSVTFAAGLAAEGMKPFCAIYSTFLQRAYDQVVHDVALQNLPVRFAIDRAGLVGADGQTHAGSFDVAYLGCLPNMVLMAASDEHELANMVYTAASYNEGPIAFRYPRGSINDTSIPQEGNIIEIGKGKLISQGDNIAILNYGARLSECMKAINTLYKKDINVTLADARFAKPLDTELINLLSKHHKFIITIEEGAIGGFGSYVLDYMNKCNLLQNSVLHNMYLPDIFQDQDTQEKQYNLAGLSADHIVNKILELTKHT